MIEETRLRKLARDLLRLDDLDGARHVAEEAVEDTDNPWPYRLILLQVQRLHGDTEGALLKLERLEQVDPPASDDIESRVGIKKLRGYYSGLLGQYKPSQQLLQEAEGMARWSGLSEILAEVHQCQAMIAFLQQDYALSDRIFRLILGLSEQIGGWYFRANALWGIGKNLMIQTQYKEAIPWLRDALAIVENAGAQLFAAVIWEELAVCHLGLGEDEVSLDLLRRAEAVQHKAGTPANYLVVVANIGNVYMYRGEYTKAVDHYRRALSIARQIKDPISVRKWTYNINLAYLRMRAAIDQKAQNAS